MTENSIHIYMQVEGVTSGDIDFIANTLSMIFDYTGKTKLFMVSSLDKDFKNLIGGKIYDDVKEIFDRINLYKNFCVYQEDEDLIVEVEHENFTEYFCIKLLTSVGNLFVNQNIKNMKIDKLFDNLFNVRHNNDTFFSYFDYQDFDVDRPF